MVLNHLWFLLQEMGLGFILTVYPMIGNNCLVQGKNKGFDRHLSTIGKSLIFTIPCSKANNKSKSVW